MTTQEIFSKNQVLTVDKAKELIGKKIACTSAEYKANQPIVSEFTPHVIISEWSNAATMEYTQGGWNNYQEYWASYMTERQIDEKKTNLLLFGNDGKCYFKAHTKYSNFYDEPTFTGSDADREVYYVEL